MIIANICGVKVVYLFVTICAFPKETLRVIWTRIRKAVLSGNHLRSSWAKKNHMHEEEKKANREKLRKGIKVASMAHRFVMGSFDETDDFMIFGWRRPPNGR